MSDSNLITPAEAVISRLIGNGEIDETNTYILSDYARRAAEVGVTAEEFYSAHYAYDPSTDIYASPKGADLNDLLAKII